MNSFRSKIFAPSFPFRPASLPFHYGWVIAIAAASGMVASIPGQTIGVNVFADSLITALRLTRTEVSLSYLVGTTISGFLLIFAGRVYDVVGSRRLIVYSSIGLAISLLYMSQVDYLPRFLGEWFTSETASWWLFMISLTFGFFLIRFTGQGFITMAGRNMVGKWWKYHRGKVLPVSGICVSVCFSLAPKAFDTLIQSFDWRAAWQILALLLLVYSIGSWLVFRDNPEECELSVDAGIAPGEKQKDDPEFTIVKELDRREALRVFGFHVITAIFGLQALYHTAYTFHVVSISEEIGISKEQILNLFVVMAIAGGAVSVVVGWLSDKYRLKYFAGLMAFGMGLSSLSLALGGDFLIPGLTIGMAISSGCFGTVSGAFLPRYFGTKHLGDISGVFMSTMIIGSAIGPYAFSMLRDLYGSYTAAYALSFATSLILFVSSFWANNPQRKLRSGDQSAVS